MSDTELQLLRRLAAHVRTLAQFLELIETTYKPSQTISVRGIAKEVERIIEELDALQK